MAEKLATKVAGLSRNDRRAGGAKRGERFVAAYLVPALLVATIRK